MKNSRKYLLVVVLLFLAVAGIVMVAAPNLPGHVYSKLGVIVNQQLARFHPARQVPSAPVVRKWLPSGTAVGFAVIGDYGLAGQAEADVAKQVLSWTPDFIIALGDNNYEAGSAGSIDANIGQYYHSFIYPYEGKYGPGAKTNKFFPVLGNHDWISSSAQPYENYFVLPGNKRYYDFVQGPVHFFMLDSDPNEPDGNTDTSVQAQWLRNALASSTSSWNIVVLHHAPFSSGKHGSTTAVQWPFHSWGADAVLAGHDHIYERLLEDTIPYFVDGISGSTIYEIGDPIPGSQVRYNADYGAMHITATDAKIVFEFINRTGAVIDSLSLDR